jgi:HPt (histidine-containing phosphotransfer) domain-containing protein
MIIYNNNKEFIGIDEDNLKSLGYSNLTSLLSEAADFADLLVKVPGHVHNFKHVHWIDFVLCATDKESSKAIIHANGKSFSCVLEIKTIYLTSAPTKQSYHINLNNLRALSGEEIQNISGELQSRPTPVAAPVIPQDEPKVQEEIEADEEPEVLTPTEASQTSHIEDAYDIDETALEAEELPELETSEVEADPYEIEDEFNLDVFEPSEDELEKIGEAQIHEDEQPSENKTISRDELHESLEDHVSIDEDLDEEVAAIEDVPDTPSGDDVELPQREEDDEDEEAYVFNIQDTADALEMDVATIQDFVDDFIMQAKDFKPKLYEAVDNEDMIELKSLSHQLKGVAANLRILDAQDILIKINKAEDFTYSIVDLDKFYRIIAKLAGEEPEQKEQATPQAPAVDDEPLEIDDEPLEIDDEPLEIDDEPLQIDDEPLEIDDKPVEVDDEPLEIDDEPLEIDDEPLEIDDEPLEIDEDPLDITDDFDSLDIEQEELIDNSQKEDLLSEVEEKTSNYKYDKMGVANEIGLDEESFNELFEDYANESKILVDQAQEGIDSDDSAKWQDAAKKLKGMSDNMRVTMFESDLEALSSIKDASDAQELLNKINEVLMTVTESKD